MTTNHTVPPNKKGSVGSRLSSARRVYASPNPVLLRLMLPLTAGLIILSIGFASYMVSQQNRRLRESSLAMLSLVSIDLQRSLAEQSRSLAMFENMLVQNADLREALKAKNRQRLLAAYAPLFASLKSDFGLTHMYFMDPERICLLRLHNPEESGDRIERFTARQAERTGKTASGVELGPLGTFTLRVVKPVFESDTLIGYLELGREIEDIFADIQKHPGIELAATISKSALKRESWENGMKLLGRDHNWERLANTALIYSSLSPFPAEAERYVGVPSHVLIDTEAEVLINDATWQIMNTPLLDASGAVIGELMVFYDISALKAEYTRILALIGSGTLVFMAILLGFLFLLIQETDAQILKQEAALRDSEERLNFMISNSPAVIYTCRPSGDYVATFVSQNVRHQMGYEASEFLADTGLWAAGIHPDDAPRIFAGITTLFTKGSNAHEYRFRHKDGTWHWMHDEMKLILNAAGEPIEILGSWVDVTDRKKTEEALRNSEEKYRTLFESATDAIFILDLEGNFIDINRTAYTRLGFTKEEMLSLHISRLDPPEFAARVPERLAQISRFGETVFESAHLRKDGSIMPVEVNSRLLEYGGQQVYFSIIRDITERKRAEERIKQNLKEKELLLREIHHRVKNNMAVISGLLDLQSARIQEDAMKKLFNESRQRIKSMALVHDKLYNTEDLSRIDFSDYINSIVKDLISSYNKEGREIITKISVGNIMLDIESAIPCGLIINELVTNVMKYAFPGKTGGEITVSFTKSRNIYTLFINDNGIGLPEGFDYTKTNTLGLQLVDALTRQLKGNLKFQSGTAANQGTSVIMTFSEKEGEAET